MFKKFQAAYQFGKTVAKKLKGNKSKVSDTITSFKPGKNLTTKRNIQDKVVKAVDEGTKKGLGGAKASDRLKQSASKMKRDESKKLKGVSYEYDRLTKKFAKTKANIEKKKKIKTVAGATAVGSGTAAAGLAFKKIRDKKMGGGMMGRRMGYSEGSNGKKFGAGDGVITPYEKRRGQAIKAAIKARKGKRMQAANGTNPPPSFEAIKKFMKTQKGKKQTTRGKIQPPEESMRDRMKQPLKKKGI